MNGYVKRSWDRKREGAEKIRVVGKFVLAHGCCALSLPSLETDFCFVPTSSLLMASIYPPYYCEKRQLFSEKRYYSHLQPVQIFHASVHLLAVNGLLLRLQGTPSCLGAFGSVSMLP